MEDEQTHDGKENEGILFDSSNFEPDFLQAVGKITINFANLELYLSLFCGMHIRAYPLIINEIITSELSFKQLVHITIAIYKEIEPDHNKIDQFTELAKKLFSLEQRRNAIIHSNYGTENKKVVRQKNTAKGKQGFRTKYENLSTKIMYDFAKEIDEINKQIGLLIYNLSSESEE